MRDAIEPRVYPWVSIYVYISGSRTVKDIREEDLDKEDVDKRYKMMDAVGYLCADVRCLRRSTQ